MERATETHIRKEATEIIEGCLDLIERMLRILDRLDPEPDLEPTLGAPEAKIGGYVPSDLASPADQSHWADGTAEDGEGEAIEDDEPSLCGPGQYLNGRLEYDLELVNEDGGNVLDEPHDEHEGV